MSEKILSQLIGQAGSIVYTRPGPPPRQISCEAPPPAGLWDVRVPDGARRRCHRRTALQGRPEGGACRTNHPSLCALFGGCRGRSHQCHLLGARPGPAPHGDAIERRRAAGQPTALRQNRSHSVWIHCRTRSGAGSQAPPPASLERQAGRSGLRLERRFESALGAGGQSAGSRGDFRHPISAHRPRSLSTGRRGLSRTL